MFFDNGASNGNRILRLHFSLCRTLFWKDASHHIASHRVALAASGFSAIQTKRSERIRSNRDGAGGPRRVVRAVSWTTARGIGIRGIPRNEWRWPSARSRSVNYRRSRIADNEWESRLLRFLSKPARENERCTPHRARTPRSQEVSVPVFSLSLSISLFEENTSSWVCTHAANLQS